MSEHTERRNFFRAFAGGSLDKDIESLRATRILLGTLGKIAKIGTIALVQAKLVADSNEKKLREMAQLSALELTALAAKKSWSSEGRAEFSSALKEYLSQFHEESFASLHSVQERTQRAEELYKRGFRIVKWLLM